MDHQTIEWIILGVLVFSFLAFLVVRITWHRKPDCSVACRWDGYAFSGGDLLLTSSNMLMQSFGGSVWGHIAIVYEEPHTGVLYSWDVRTPTVGALGFFGTRKYPATRISPLLRFLERWKGPVAVRKLQGKRPIDPVVFRDFIMARKDQPFAFDFVAQGVNRLMFFNVPLQARTENGPKFCAEMAAETYQHLGVFKFNTRGSHEVTPRDFSERSERLPCVNGYSFGRECLLTAPPKGTKIRVTADDLEYICKGPEALKPPIVPAASLQRGNRQRRRRRSPSTAPALSEDVD